MRPRRVPSRRVGLRAGSWNHRLRPLLETMESRRLLAMFGVTNTNDSGPGSLRQAILDANSSPGADTIQFGIPASDSNFDPHLDTWTIRPSTTLPQLTEQVLIDGYSQRASRQSISIMGSPTGGTFTLTYTDPVTSQ